MKSERQLKFLVCEGKLEHLCLSGHPLGRQWTSYLKRDCGRQQETYLNNFQNKKAKVKKLWDNLGS